MSVVRVVELHTSEGSLSVQLYDEHASELCHAFVNLALSGQLNGPLFRQMIPGFAVLGDAYQCREQDTVYGLLTNSSETRVSKERPLHHVGAGLFTCAVQEGTVATGRFLITLGPQPLLDNEYTIFGRLYSGLSLLTRISKMQTDAQGNLFSPIVVQRCSVITVPAVTAPVTTTESSSTRVKKGRLTADLDA